jgi:hypothetical protein
MLKKVLLVTFLLVIVAVLAIGAIIRTSDKVVGTRGNGRGQGFGNVAYAAQASSVEWVAVEGTVVEVNEIAMTVQTTTGDQIVVENRPWLYALEQKFSANVGDQIRMKSFADNGYFTAAQLQNLTNGKTAQLRDETGRPGWSGRGRGSGSGG